jgi:hypothetical protein
MEWTAIRLWQHEVEKIFDACIDRIVAAIYGHKEILAFDDPDRRLPAIDRLKGFHTGGPCLYRRVLLPIRTNGTVLPTWLYMVGDRWTGNFKELAAGIWR